MEEAGQSQRVNITDNVALDFSGLFGATEGPVKPLSETGPNNTPAKPEKAVESPTEGPEKQQARQLYREASREEEDHRRIQEMYKDYQDNIKASFQLQTEILKGLKAGEDVYTLFLKATKAIALMTDNSTFYSRTEEDIKIIYGRGLQEKTPLQLELQEAEERLQKLGEAIDREESSENRARIQKAIDANEARKEKLIKMIEGAKL